MEGKDRRDLYTNPLGSDDSVTLRLGATWTSRPRRVPLNTRLKSGLTVEEILYGEIARDPTDDLTQHLDSR